MVSSFPSDFPPAWTQGPLAVRARLQNVSQRLRSRNSPLAGNRQTRRLLRSCPNTLSKMESRSPLAPRDPNVENVWAGQQTPRTGTPKLKRAQSENVAPNSAARAGFDPASTLSCTPSVADRLALVYLNTPKRLVTVAAGPPATPAHLSRAHDALAAVCIKARRSLQDATNLMPLRQVEIMLCD